MFNAHTRVRTYRAHDILSTVTRVKNRFGEILFLLLLLLSIAVQRSRRTLCVTRTHVQRDTDVRLVHLYNYLVRHIYYGGRAQSAHYNIIIPYTECTTYTRGAFSLNRPALTNFLPVFVSFKKKKK